MGTPGFSVSCTSQADAKRACITFNMAATKHLMEPTKGGKVYSGSQFERVSACYGRGRCSGVASLEEICGRKQRETTTEPRVGTAFKGRPSSWPAIQASPLTAVTAPKSHYLPGKVVMTGTLWGIRWAETTTELSRSLKMAKHQAFQPRDRGSPSEHPTGIQQQQTCLCCVWPVRCALSINELAWRFLLQESIAQIFSNGRQS